MSEAGPNESSVDEAIDGVKEAKRKAVTSKELVALCQKLRQKLQQSEARCQELTDNCQRLEQEAQVARRRFEEQETPEKELDPLLDREPAQRQGGEAAVQVVASEASLDPHPQVRERDKEAQARIQHLEDKLAETAQRLKQTFQLLKAEKEAGVEKTALLEESQGKLVRQREQVAAVLERQQEKVQLKDQELMALNAKVADLTAAVTRLELQRDRMISEAEAAKGDRQQLAEAMAALEDLRQTLFRERNRREQDADMEAEERERALLEIERQKTEWERQRCDVEEAHAHALAAAESRGAACKLRAEELDAANQRHLAALRAAEQDVAAKEATINRLQKQLQEKAQRQKEALDEESARQSSKYEQLLKELAVYRSRSAQVIADQQQQLELQATELARLKDEIKTGEPTERRIFELAELQSRRDELVAEYEEELCRLRAQQQQNEQAVALLRQQQADHQRDIEKLTNSKTRAQINLDYLSSIMVQFLQAFDKPKERRALVPVIAKLLSFGEEELRAIQLYEQRQQPRWWSKVPSA